MFNFREGQEIFLFSTTFKPAPASSQAPLQRISEDVSPWVKRQGRETDQSPPSGAEVKNGEVIPLIPHTSYRRGT
jgi:hypothetical protein